MSSGSDNSASPKRENYRDGSSRSRSREKKDRQCRDRERDRKVKIRVPELSAPICSFRHFTNMQAEKINSDTLQKAYDKYKKEWDQRQGEEFLKEYRNDAWFSEKYDPEVLDVLERERKQNCKKMHEEFMAKFTEGSFDKINLSIADPNQLGLIIERSQEEEQQQNTPQTIDVHVGNQTLISENFFCFDSDAKTMFIKAVPRAVSRYDIRQIVEGLKGYRQLTMSDPVRKNNLSRYCWIEFDSEQNAEKAVLGLSGLIIKNETLVVSKSSTKIKKVKVLKNYPKQRMQKDICTLQKLIKKLDEEVGLSQNQLLQKQFLDDNNKMDIYLVYLRKVHAFDYFSGIGFENERVLTMKISSAFLRVEADYEEMENVQTVFKKIQEKAEERIEKTTKDYMGLLRQEIQILIKDVEKINKDGTREKQIWKCFYCDKKFKTCEFLAKHIISKHDDIKFKKIQTVMDRLYMEDSNKITFASTKDRQDRYKKPFNSAFRRDRKKDYRDYDEPEPEKEKGNKPVGPGNRPMLNFLDI